ACVLSCAPLCVRNCVRIMTREVFSGEIGSAIVGVPACSKLFPGTQLTTLALDWYIERRPKMVAKNNRRYHLLFALGLCVFLWSLALAASSISVLAGPGAPTNGNHRACYELSLRKRAS